MVASTSAECPKCGHRRGLQELAPAWQCPACGIAYHKYQAYLERTQQLVTPRPAQEIDVLADWQSDRSLWTLVVVNVAVISIGLLQGWSLQDMMLIYWCQSIIIGFSYIVRILCLKDFCTEGFLVDDEPVEATPKTKRETAAFMTFHFGIFNVVHLVFLVQAFGAEFHAGVVVCALGFAANHLYSLRYNLEVDRRGKPNIGNLMVMPYLRVFPMHLTIIGGGFLLDKFGEGGAAGPILLLFLVLKTLADIGTHLAEHRKLAGPSIVSVG